METLGVLDGILASILFDFGTLDSFISPSLIEHCGLVATKQND